MMRLELPRKSPYMGNNPNIEDVNLTPRFKTQNTTVQRGQVKCMLP